MSPRGDGEVPEVVCLNRPLFNPALGNLEAEPLERRLELALAALPQWTCLNFDCGDLSVGCTTFHCITFRVI